MSITMSPVVKRPRAFLGISFYEQDKAVKQWFESILRVCGFEVVTAERSEHIELGEKIRRKIRSCDVACFVLTPRDKIADSGNWLPPSWIQGEIGIAYDSDRRIAVLVEEKVEVKGIIPSIEDYTPFSRGHLNEDTHLVLASILSLRFPVLQDAIETLLNQSELAPLIVIKALRRIASRVANLRRMKATLPVCPVVSLIQNQRPILILARGRTDGILEDSTWVVSRSRVLGEQAIEELVGTVRVVHLQDRLAQAVFDDWAEENKMKEAFDDYTPDGTSRKLQDWEARAEDPDFLPNSSVSDIDNFVRMIDELVPVI